MTEPSASSGRTRKVLLVASVWAFEILGASDVFSGRSSTVVDTVVYAAVGSVLLWWRLRFPVLVLVATLVHMLGALVLLPEYRPVGITLVALYTVAANTGAVVAVIALLGMYALTAPIIVFDELSRPLAPQDSPAGVTRALLLAQAIALVACWGVGRWARATRQAARLREELADGERRDAIREERFRIAREMHDVVSHAVTTMTVQAAAARHLMPVDPERAAYALERVEDGGSAAVGELRTMLGVLRSDEAPSPDGIADAMGSLVEGARRTGLWVRVERDATVDASPEVALVVVRAVQETLTNVVKYAGRGADVEIDLRSTPTGLRLTVRDDGGVGLPVPQPRRSGGYGLAGLAERVAAVGGTFFAAPSAESGFEVVLDLPSKISDSDGSMSDSRPPGAPGGSGFGSGTLLCSPNVDA